MEHQDFVGLASILEGAYNDWAEQFKVWPCIQALGIRPYVYNGRWFFRFSYIDRYDIVGEGETIEEAAKNFYKAMCETKLISI